MRLTCEEITPKVLSTKVLLTKNSGNGVTTL